MRRRFSHLGLESAPVFLDDSTRPHVLRFSEDFPTNAKLDDAAFRQIQTLSRDAPFPCSGLQKNIAVENDAYLSVTPVPSLS